MINFICSLWGNKYSIEYVDKLYSMVERNCSRKFKFYCQTDRMGFREEINVLPFLQELPESTPYEMKHSKDYLNGLPRLWDRPKLNYFKPKAWDIEGIKVSLDIDIVIQNNMEPLFKLYLEDDSALIGRSWWHNMEHEALPQWRRRYGARNNGGCMIWKDAQVEGIWEDLMEYWKYIYFCFHGGSDNFISTRHLDKFRFIPPEMFYSFNRGCKWPDDIKMYEHRKDKIICVFNTDVGNPVHLELHTAARDFPWVKKYWQ